MTLIVRNDPMTIDFLCREFSDKYNLYVNDYLRTVDGQYLNDAQLKQGFLNFVALMGWRAQVVDILNIEKAKATSIIEYRTPNYMHAYVPEFFESLEVVDSKETVYTSDSLCGQFLLFLKSANVLDPMVTHRHKPTPPIGLEFVRSWVLEIDDQQKDYFIAGLKKLIDSPDHVIVEGLYTADAAEELLNMMEDKLIPSPMINGLCL